MRLSNGISIIGVALCINIASPMWAKNDATGPQTQGPDMQTQSNQMAVAAASFGKIILVPSPPVLKVDNGACEENIRKWDHWYYLCLKECKDIAAGYAFSYSNKNTESLSYKRELTGCLSACDSKYIYYRDSLC